MCVYAICGWQDINDGALRDLGAGLKRPRTPHWTSMALWEVNDFGRLVFDAVGTRLQGKWSRVERFSIKPGEVGLTTLEEAGDRIDQDAKSRLAQLATGVAPR